MWDIFSSIGVIDNLKKKGSLKHYKEKLNEYQHNEADVLIDMGLLYYEDEKYDESLYHLKKAEHIYSSLNEKESEAFVNDLIGDVYLSIREMDMAMNKYQKAFELYSESKSPMKDDLLDKLTEVNDIKEAIELSKAEDAEYEYVDISTDDTEYLESKKDTMDKCYFSYEKISFKIDNIIKIVKNKYNIRDPSKEEYESGYFQKGIFEAHKSDDSEREVAMLQVLSNFLMKENKPFSAMQNLKTAFDISHESGNKKGEAFSLLLLGVVYYILGKENKVYEIFRKSLIIFKDINYKKGEKIALDIINTLYTEDECSYISLSN